MRCFGLLGRSLRHSFSKDYFTRKFNNEGIADCSYELFEIPSISDLPALLRSKPDLAGLNVTIPYKEEILSFLDFPDDVVKQVGACNCISLNDGKLYGHNTDVTGFKESILPILKPADRTALILGSGGASKAVIYALAQLGIIATTVSRASGVGRLSYQDLDEELVKSNRIIANTTPLGTFPDVEQAPPFPYTFLTPDHLLFDLVYNPSKTRFLKEGEDRGCRIMNGAEMLHIQAEESWKIWNS